MLKLSEDGSELQWKSLECILQQPKHSEKIEVAKMQGVRTHDEGMSNEDFHVSYSSESWLGLQRNAEACLYFQVCEPREAAQWKAALQELWMIGKDVQQQKQERAMSTADKQSNSKKRLEERQAKRKEQLAAMGPVGMKNTAIAMSKR